MLCISFSYSFNMNATDRFQSEAGFNSSVLLNKNDTTGANILQSSYIVGLMNILAPSIP